MCAVQWHVPDVAADVSDGLLSCPRVHYSGNDATDARFGAGGDNRVECLSGNDAVSTKSPLGGAMIEQQSRSELISEGQTEIIPVSKLPTEHGITRLDLAVPPFLAQAFGYSGGQRWVAFHWDSIFEYLSWTDGALPGCGGSWRAWLLYTRHPAVAPALAAFDFTSSEVRPKDWLLIDCEEHVLYAGPASAVHEFLSALPAVELPKYEFASDSGPSRELRQLIATAPPLEELARFVDENENDDPHGFHDRLVEWLEHGA